MASRDRGVWSCFVCLIELQNGKLNTKTEWLHWKLTAELRHDAKDQTDSVTNSRAVLICVDKSTGIHKRVPQLIWSVPTEGYSDLKPAITHLEADQSGVDFLGVPTCRHTCVRLQSRWCWRGGGSWTRFHYLTFWQELMLTTRSLL